MSTSPPDGRVPADPRLLPAPSSPVMTLAWEREGGVTVVQVHGEIDMSNAHLIVELAAHLCDEPGSRVLLDLSRVRFIDLHGLTALTEAEHRIRAGGGVLTLRDPARCVTRLMRLTGTSAPTVRAHPDGTRRNGMLPSVTVAARPGPATAQLR